MHSVALARLFCGLLFPGFIYGADLDSKYQPPPHANHYVAIDNVCAWPILTKVRDGFIATIHNEPSHGLHEGDVDCWKSSDGEFWKKLGTPAPHEANTVRMNVAAGMAPNGDLIVLSSGWSNLQQPGKAKQSPFRDAILRSWVCISKDGGATWKRTEDFPAPEQGSSEYVPFGDIVPAGDGSLLTSCYAQIDSKSGLHHSWAFRSRDNGRTWNRGAVIGPKHDETHLLHLGGKRWLAAARFEAVDLFRSEDDGQTWQGPRQVTENAELNGHLLKLKDGRILLSYGNRIKGEFGVCGKFSSDEGKTWGKPFRLAEAMAGDCGYPSSVQREDGKIVTAFYSKAAASHERYHMGVTVWSPNF